MYPSYPYDIKDLLSCKNNKNTYNKPHIFFKKEKTMCTVSAASKSEIQPLKYDYFNSLKNSLDGKNTKYFVVKPQTDIKNVAFNQYAHIVICGDSSKAINIQLGHYKGNISVIGENISVKADIISGNIKIYNGLFSLAKDQKFVKPSIEVNKISGRVTMGCFSNTPFFKTYYYGSLATIFVKDHADSIDIIGNSALIDSKINNADDIDIKGKSSLINAQIGKIERLDVSHDSYLKSVGINEIEKLDVSYDSYLESVSITSTKAIFLSYKSSIKNSHFGDIKEFWIIYNSEVQSSNFKNIDQLRLFDSSSIKDSNFDSMNELQMFNNSVISNVKTKQLHGKAFTGLLNIPSHQKPRD